MLIQPVPCVAVVVAVLQACHFRHAPIDQRMHMALHLIASPLQPITLVSRDTDVLDNLVLFTKRTKEAFTRTVLQLGCTPTHTGTRPAVASMDMTVPLGKLRICFPLDRGVKHEILICLFTANTGNWSADFAFQSVEVIIHRREFKPGIANKMMSIGICLSNIISNIAVESLPPESDTTFNFGLSIRTHLRIGVDQTIALDRNLIC